LILKTLLNVNDIKLKISFVSSKNVLIITNPGFQYVIYTHSMSSELIWQYVISEENPSAEDYLT